MSLLSWIPAKGTVIDTLRLSTRLPKLDQDGIRMISLPDTLIRVRIAGEGKTTIVFACDPPNVVEQFDEVIEQLPGYRVICFEQPGFGFSYPKSGFGFTLPEYVRALRRLLQTLDMGPYVLVMPCVSTYYGIVAAAEHPELIQHLVLMQATSWEQELYWVEELARFFVLITNGIPFIGNKLMGIPYLGQLLGALTERWFPQLTQPFAVYQAKKRPALLAKFMVPGKAAFQRGACNCMASFYQEYFRERNLQFPCPPQPTLVLWANRDLSHDNRRLLNKVSSTLRRLLIWAMFNEIQSDKRGLLSYVPQARFREIDRTGHHLELENPRTVCGEIRAFIESVARTR